MQGKMANKFGSWVLDFSSDGKVDVVSFTAAAPSQMRGLGDMVAAVTSAIGVKPCESCKQRRDAFNLLVPFGQKETSPPPEGNGEGEAK